MFQHSANPYQVTKLTTTTATPARPVTVADLFAAGRTITRMDGRNYQGYPQGYRDDSNTRRSQRRAAESYRSEHLLAWDLIIPPGEYDRIDITPAGKVEYCAGQYATTEFYGCVRSVLVRLRQLREEGKVQRLDPNT